MAENALLLAAVVARGPEAAPAPYVLSLFHAVAWMLVVMTRCGWGDVVGGRYG